MRRKKEASPGVGGFYLWPWEDETEEQRRQALRTLALFQEVPFTPALQSLEWPLEKAA